MNEKPLGTSFETLETEYRKLVNSIDATCDSLYTRHAEHIQCKRGCYQCCSALSIHPAEYLCIEREIISQTGKRPARVNSQAEGCAFLSNHVCSIYRYRPIICRIHGLPITYPIFEYDDSGMQVANTERQTTWCDLNFLNTNEDEFEPDACVDMPHIEDMLFEMDTYARAAKLTGDDEDVVDTSDSATLLVDFNTIVVDNIDT